jgi:hypothetical protein
MIFPSRLLMEKESLDPREEEDEMPGGDGAEVGLAPTVRRRGKGSMMNWPACRGRMRWMSA